MARKKRIKRTPTTFPHSIIVPVASHRKAPDPVLSGVRHHTGYVPAILYPGGGFPNDPNLRPANIDRLVYKEIAKSLLNEECTPNTYHLKSKGEVQAASRVRELSPSDSRKWFEENLSQFFDTDSDQFEEFTKKYTLLEITYEEGQGILDGGHTDSIWSDDETMAEVRSSVESDDKDEWNLNHLPIEWITGIPKALVAEIVGGRNTAVQVHEKTLANHQNKFKWIKDLLADEHYAGKIAYRENEPRSEKPIDIRELLAVVLPFNRKLYSFEGEPKKRLPVFAFSSKQSVLQAYVTDDDNGRTFRSLSPIFKDILQLQDLIHLTAVKRYNAERKGKGGRFTFVDHRGETKKGKMKKPHDFVFSGETGRDKLADGALYPMLAAFSGLVVENGDGVLEWGLPGGFEDVKALWSQLAPDFMEVTGNESVKLGRNPAQIGKSRNHWEFLYLKVKMRAGAALTA